LSRIPNPVPFLSRFECNVTSHVDEVYTWPIATSLSFVLKMHQTNFRPDPVTPLRKLNRPTTRPKLPNQLGEGYPFPKSHPSTPSVSRCRRFRRLEKSRFSTADLRSLYPQTPYQGSVPGSRLGLPSPNRPNPSQTPTFRYRITPLAILLELVVNVGEL